MTSMQTVVLGVHTLVALLVIVLVLLQRGKGADAGAAFGAGASGTVFGARGSASFFSRATAVLATLFFATSLGLAYLSSQRAGGPESLLDAMPATTVEETGETGTAGTAETAEGDFEVIQSVDEIPSLDALPGLMESDTIEDLPAIEEEPPSEGQQ